MLKAERKRAKLTPQQVADELGVPQSYVAKYEGGERRLDVLEFIAVVRAIGADPVEIFGAAERNALTKAPSVGAAVPNLHERLR